MNSDPLLSTLRADPDYLAWWNELLESEAFKKTHWKDVEPSGFKPFKEMSAATGKTTAAAFVERDGDFFKFLPVSEFIRLYKEGGINDRKIPIPTVLKTEATERLGVAIFVDPR